MSFRAICKEIARNRRAKLVACVCDAYSTVYSPPQTRESVPDAIRAQAIAKFNALARIPVTRTPLKDPGSTNPVIATLPGYTLTATTLTPRMVIDGASTEWTDTQLYLQFLDQLCLRIPGLPIEINGALSPPVSATVRSVHIEAWIQMTVSDNLQTPMLYHL